MGIETVIQITLYLSAVLGVLAAQAATVALVRLVRGPIEPQGNAAERTSSIGASRSVVLIAFTILCSSMVLREGVVIFGGAVNWSFVSFVLTDIAKLMKITAACLFIWAITRQQCGHKMWAAMLGLSVVVAVLLLRG